MNFFPQPCEFPRVSGHLLHHEMTNQNGQGQVLRGQAPSESARLGAKQGHATSATHNSKPHSHPAPIRSGFHTFILSHLSTIQHPRVSTSRNRGEKFKIQNCDVLTLTPSPLNPLIPRRLPAAFSLTEVVIAMGVAAVAFTSIIALFPLGLNMSKESYEETQAALLAQTILSDLRDKQSGSNTDNRLIQIGPDNSPTNGIATRNYINVDTSSTYLAPITCYVAYNQETRTDTLYRDVELRPFEGSLSKPPWWDTGNPKATTLAMITVSATFRPDSTVVDNPQRVDVYIESPGNLPAASRKQFPFTGGVAP